MSFDIDGLKDDIWDDLQNEIKQCVDNNVEHFVDRKLDSHMEDQPYSIECSYCHKDLDVTMKSVDSSYDLSLRIEPCDCQKDE